MQKTIYIQKIFLLIVVTFSYSIAMAQQFKSPDVIPSSPQSQLIENFYEKYFNNDISARGEKTIDINLYDIEVKGLNIPINISYNTCGVKYKQSSGDVGVGWTLSPAARISRTIIGYPDEAMKRVPTLFDDLNKLNNHIDVDKYLSAFSSGIMGNVSYFSVASRDQGCDIFTFSTLSESGHFVFPDPSTLDKVEILEKINCQITPILTGGLLTGFQIVDGHGITYNYGGNASEHVHEDAYRTDISSGTTGWALKSIVTTKNDTVRFDYVGYTDRSITEPEYKTLSVNDSYAYRMYVQDEGDVQVQQEYELSIALNFNITLPNYTTFLLSGIEANGIKVNFFRASADGIYSNAVDSITVVDKQSGDIIKQINLSYSGMNKRPHFFLDRLEMDGQKYYLSYYTPSDLGLGEYDNTHYTSDLWGYYLYSSTSLDKVDLPVISREFVDDSFVFFKPVPGASLYDDVIKKLSRIIPNVNFKNDSDNTKAHLFSLKKIYFPTGGSQEFIYEPNEYLLNSARVKGTGIRLSNVKTYDDNGNLHEQRYKYGENEDGIGVPSFHLSCETFADVKQNRIQYSTSPGLYDYVSFCSRIYSPVAFGDANISSNFFVEYPQVHVYNKQEKGENKISYLFNLLQPLYIDVMPENTNEKYVGSPDLLNNRGWKSYIHRYQYGIKTNIASCRYFNSDGRLVKKEDYTYCRSAGLVMDGGIKMEQVVIPVYQDTYDFAHTIELSRPSLFKYMTYSVMSGRDLLSKKVVSEYFAGGTVVSEEGYVYDDKNQLIKVIRTSQNGGGDCRIKNIKYPYNYTDAISNLMVERNMLDYPVETITEYNGEEVYREQIKYGLYQNLLLPAYVDISHDGLLGLKREMTYVSYDKKGNILEYVDKNNNHTCYIWGYNYKYPIAEIQGATYDSVKSVLGHENNDLSYLQGYGEYQLERELNKLRMAFRDNHPVFIKTFLYKPYVGVTSITTSDGFTTKYGYDQFGYLKESYLERNGRKQLIQEFKYNYKL